MNRLPFIQLGSAFAIVSFTLTVYAQTPRPSPSFARMPHSGDAPPTCVQEALNAEPGSLTLSYEEVAAVCRQENKELLVSQVASACGQAVADNAAAARDEVCRTDPRIGAGTALDVLAKTYHAATVNLPMEPRGGAPSDTEKGSGVIREHGVAATVVAQGIGDFLVGRAEKEVSAFATVELFSRLCTTDTKGLLPETCQLLQEQNNGADPVGLGLLRRTVIADLHDLPDDLLQFTLRRTRAALEDTTPDDRKRKVVEVQRLLCSADFGYAFVKALRARQAVDQVIQTPSTTVGIIKSYAVLATEAECTDFWTAVEKSAATAGSLAKLGEALKVAVDELRKASTLPEQQVARRDVVDKAIAIAVYLAPNNAALFDEVGVLAVAVWNEDWIEVVRGAASAKTLGPVLLCSEPTSCCLRDGKVRLILSIAADVASAKSSDQVEAVLERVAEPVGTWRRKFEDTLTFNLQGYVGAKLAQEDVQGGTPPAMSLAPVLAVGVEVSLNYSRTGRIGLFGQVVDVGNFANVRLASDDEDELLETSVPEVELAQLFAPGIYAVWTPAKMPFVLGAGFDWVPALRTTPEGVRAAWHVGGFLAVDVPILELAHQ